MKKRYLGTKRYLFYPDMWVRLNPDKGGLFCGKPVYLERMCCGEPVYTGGSFDGVLGVISAVIRSIGRVRHYNGVIIILSVRHYNIVLTIL